MSVNQSFNSDHEFLTTNATPTEIQRIGVPEANTCSVDFQVMARGVSDGTSALWAIKGCVKRVGNGSLTAVGAVITLFTARKDLGASLWDVSFSIDTNDNSIVFTVTGAALQSVGWVVTGSIVGFITANA